MERTLLFRAVHFRAMNPAEPPASDLIEAMIVELIPLYGRIDVPGMPAAGPQEFSPPGGTFLVGRDDDGTVLCGGGVKRLDDDVAEIKRMYVIPEARGRGLARELLAALEDAARDLGYARVRLDTGPEQPTAERLFRAEGYAEIGNFNDNVMASFWGVKKLR